MKDIYMAGANSLVLGTYIAIEKFNVIQLTDFLIKTGYYNLQNIEKAVQLRNREINK